MFSLSPEKLFFVLIVALVLLGPDKLPRLARQLGAGWAKLQAFQQKMEDEVRQSVPNLPSSQELVRIARAPVAYLSSMAASAADEGLVPDPGATEPRTDEDFPPDPARPPTAGTNGRLGGQPTLVPNADLPEHPMPADPGMN